MEKKIITKTVFQKHGEHPIKFSEINIELEPNDLIDAGYEEPFYGGDSGHDGYHHLTVTRRVEETDEEAKIRIEREVILKEDLRKRRYQNYIKLKNEFDGK